VKTTLAFSFALALAACSSAENRYAANIQHVYVSRWTHLGAADRDQIVRLVSTATRQPIQGITVQNAKTSSTRISVFTGFRDSEMVPWTEFILDKRADRWHIVSRSVISSSMATILLTNQ
jgi:hypothetical protein